MLKNGQPISGTDSLQLIDLNISGLEELTDFFFSKLPFLVDHHAANCKLPTANRKLQTANRQPQSILQPALHLRNEQKIFLQGLLEMGFQNAAHGVGFAENSRIAVVVRQLGS